MTLRPTFLHDVGILVACLLVTRILIHDNVVVLVALLLLCGVGWTLRHDPLSVRFFVVGGFVGAAFDVLRVWRGVYTYVAPDVAGFPIFMPVLWGQIFWTIRCTFAALDSHVGESWRAPLGARESIATVLLAIVAIPALGHLHVHPLATLVIAVACFVAFLAFAGRRGDLALGLLFALLGPLAEAFCVASDLYRFEDRTTIPPWLPALWALYALIIRRAAGRLWARSTSTRDTKEAMSCHR